MQTSARKKSQSAEKFSLGKKRPYPDSENDSNTRSHKRHKSSDSEGKASFQSGRRQKSGRLRGKSESKTFEALNHVKLLRFTPEHSENSSNEHSMHINGVDKQEAFEEHKFVAALFSGHYPGLELPHHPQGVDKSEDGNVRLFYKTLYFEKHDFWLRENDVLGLVDRKHVGHFHSADFYRQAHLYRFLNCEVVSQRPSF